MAVERFAEMVPVIRETFGVFNMLLLKHTIFKPAAIPVHCFFGYIEKRLERKKAHHSWEKMSYAEFFIYGKS